ncbi:hypothetical protein U1Q18_002403, partial [Sarracenia purpurea var. burkii]
LVENGGGILVVNFSRNPHKTSRGDLLLLLPEGAALVGHGCVALHLLQPRVDVRLEAQTPVGGERLNEGPDHLLLAGMESVVPEYGEAEVPGEEGAVVVGDEGCNGGGRRKKVCLLSQSSN